MSVLSCPQKTRDSKTSINLSFDFEAGTFAYLLCKHFDYKIDYDRSYGKAGLILKEINICAIGVYYIHESNGCHNMAQCYTVMQAFLRVL